MAQVTLFPGVAVITGAGGTGIGNAAALAFVEAGCTKLAVTDLDVDTLNATVKQIQWENPLADVYAEAGDISDEKFVDRFISKAAGQYGRIDYCVNSAGILSRNESSTEMSAQDFDAVNNVNYRGCWLTSRAQLKVMLKQEPLPSHDHDRAPQRGSIVNIASQLGLVARPKAPAYCASKAAVIAMTRADAIDYSEHGIRVNCICPGVIETPMTTGTPEVTERLKPAIDIAPMRRMGKPSEVADAALFLCSTKASFVQGHAMVVDGGYIIN
ncbi:short-chain dehydrogenase reductase family [Diplodia corticola]|uniref:Short-chain dehydrogenase reductase family n=1 Tax=Diplodia corticola TaxID=236234 RepID=A0A1J9R7F6_9PEZI|nr:short-chain dehydrogenase reductase family [Diplodia corticola]OJD36138.1 short-chain dehydrogenase reductase family [Diplodia corticola]